MNTIQHIIRMERGETSNSSSPMWRCQTSEGERVNIFKHTDPVKNNFRLFDAAGYGADLIAMELNESLNWNTFPIAVDLTKADGSKWWEIAAVHPRPAGSIPDANMKPDASLYRAAVESWSRGVLHVHLPVVLWDTETTGLGINDEIIDIGIYGNDGIEIFSSLIKPSRPELLTPQISQITGITYDMLQDAPSFTDVYPQIYTALQSSISLIYNAEFDMQMLERACMRAGLKPVPILAVECVMHAFARWHGEWDFKRGDWVNKPLSFALDHLDLIPDYLHRAAADARSTYRVIRAMAGLDDSDE